MKSIFGVYVDLLREARRKGESEDFVTFSDGEVRFKVPKDYALRPEDFQSAKENGLAVRLEKPSEHNPLEKATVVLFKVRKVSKSMESLYAHEGLIRDENRSIVGYLIASGGELTLSKAYEEPLTPEDEILFAEEVCKSGATKKLCLKYSARLVLEEMTNRGRN